MVTPTCSIWSHGGLICFIILDILSVKMSNSTTDDFLFYGKKCLEKKEVPKLGSGSKILFELEELMRHNEVIATSSTKRLT